MREKCRGKKGLSGHALYGVPKRLMWDAGSVEELNESVAWFCSKWNNNTLGYYDSSMRRGDKEGLERTALWLRIMSEELREMAGYVEGY